MRGAAKPYSEQKVITELLSMFSKNSLKVVQDTLNLPENELESVFGKHKK